MGVAIIGIVAGWTVWNFSLESPVAAARLVPAETLLLAEWPDLPGSALRWRHTALAGIVREPEVQAFLGKPLARLGQNAGWARAIGSLARLQPRSAFLAVATITENMPHAVFGINYAGKRQEAEALIAEGRAQVQAASPDGKLLREPYGKLQIESYSDNGITIAVCVTHHSIFVANDRELLKSVLDHASGQMLVALNSSRAYRKSVKQLPRHPDFRLFVQPNPYSDKLLAGLVQPVASGPGKIEAMALGLRFEGANLRERLFILQNTATPHPRLSYKTLGLTTPRTLFYGAMAPLLSEGSVQDPGVPPSGHPMRVLFSALSATPPATFSEFKSAFGPEHALLLDWPQTQSQPNLFLALEVRNPAQARKFVETAFRAWTRADAAGVSFWINNGNLPIHPAVALTERHFLAGLSPESLAPFASSAAHLPTQEGTLAQSPAYLKAMSAVGKPSIGMAYLDARPFFERFYGWLRPVIIFWGSLKMGEISDFSNLPLPETIGRHLTPISLSATQSGPGILLESTGPITFLEVSAGLGVVGGAMILPRLQVVPPPKKLPGTPPLQPSPLSAPASPEP